MNAVKNAHAVGLELRMWRPAARMVGAFALAVAVLGCASQAILQQAPAATVNSPTAGDPVASDSAARAPAQYPAPHKKMLVFKRALSASQYEALNAATELPSSYASAIIRTYQPPTVYSVTGSNVPRYDPSTAVRVPMFAYSMPVVNYDPVEFPPMYFQGPGIPYANRSYVPPITSPYSNFTSPTFNNPSTFYNPPTYYNPPTFYNPPSTWP